MYCIVKHLLAYRNEGEWYWSLDDSYVNVEITAWKHNCEPYDGK